jgi:hypothetical protein
LLYIATTVILTGEMAGTAQAQIVTMTGVNYTQPVMAPPTKATATPEGTMSLPADGEADRVYCDFGTVAGGTFAADVNVSAGGASVVVITRVGGKGAPQPWNTVASGPFELTNPPAGLYCRARLQKQANGNQWPDVAGAVVYLPCP